MQDEFIPILKFDRNRFRLVELEFDSGHQFDLDFRRDDSVTKSGLLAFSDLKSGNIFNYSLFYKKSMNRH